MEHPDTELPFHPFSSFSRELWNNRDSLRLLMKPRIDDDVITKKPADKVAKKPAGKEAKKPAGKVAKKPAGKVTKQPSGKTKRK